MLPTNLHFRCGPTGSVPSLNLHEHSLLNQSPAPEQQAPSSSGTHLSFLMTSTSRGSLGNRRSNAAEVTGLVLLPPNLQLRAAAAMATTKSILPRHKKDTSSSSAASRSRRQGSKFGFHHHRSKDGQKTIRPETEKVNACFINDLGQG
jgi:hypothetical protein